MSVWLRELATRPEDLPLVFADRFNSGDAGLLAEVYEESAVLAVRPGEAVSGAELRAANGRLRELGVPIAVRPRQTYRNGDLALLIVDWVVEGTGRDGEAVRVAGTATDVARLGPDGRWRYVIDNPFGPRPDALPGALVEGGGLTG
ncbi:MULTISPECIES: YybH family protein [unclassified Streptomyces]|uniref:YybH family protein n=1 Tax=unclassified Streptomyces TaxID=2593676 RepID=UPI0036C2605E